MASLDLNADLLDDYGESLIGAPEQGLSNVELTGEAMEKFIITLFGRCVWIVLRPWNGLSDGQ
jgi:hypothetical protein